MDKKIGFIGAGNMATAIVGGILGAKLCPPEGIYVYDVSETACEKMKQKGINISNDILTLLDMCNIVFLAVKPQVYPDVLQTCAEFKGEMPLFVSIAAGISTRYIQNNIGEGVCVVRAMPNTPLLLSEGATALCKSDNTSDADFAAVKSIFEASGIVSVLNEDKMNEVISVNGSSPAYVYLFAKAIIDGACEQGIDRKTATELVIKTLYGSAKMLECSGSTPDELIKMVSSPGGTTLKALDVLYEANFEQTVKNAMLACTKRAEELGK